jgi:anti-sigma B factor antagonist
MKKLLKKKVLGMMGALEIELEGFGDIVLMALSGQVDNYTAEEITKIIDEYIIKGDLKIIIDLAKIDYLDSAGLSAFINARIRLSKRNGVLCLVGLKDKTRQIFEIAGLTKMFDIYESREAAFEGL